jgi:hypothetical protein
VKHAARDHAKYSGSTAARTLACAAWVRLSAGLPARGETDAAEEGTEAHELLDQCMAAGLERAPRDSDPEMANAVNAVLDYVTNLRILHGPGLVVIHELPLPFPQCAVPELDAMGIPDLIAISGRHAWSIDFKYGAGLMVEASHNAQLLYSATSAFWSVPITKVTCVVIQPRGWHPAGAVREWITDGVELAEFQRRFEAAIMRAEAGGDPTPGAHCRFCPAAIVCPAFERQAVEVLQPGASDYRQVPGTLPPPKTIPMDRVAQIVDRADYVRNWLKEVESYAYEQARAGVPVLGRKLVEAQARRKWNGKPLDIAQRLYQMAGGQMPMEDIMPAKLAPLTEIEDRLVQIARAAALPGTADDAARQMRERLAFLTTKTSSGNLSLVPLSDPRPAADRVAQTFKGVVIPPLPGQE